MSADGLRRGADGRDRCAWCGDDPLYVTYHDEEWGRPERDEQRLFEMMVLESFQAGLSWATILRKREAFRAAFAGFAPAAVARFGDADVARLLADTGIVRHRAKIEAAIVNASAVLALADRGETLASVIWSAAPATPTRPRTAAYMTARAAASAALAGALRERGFRFLGETTSYSLMQAAGVVNDHLPGCFRAVRSA